MGKYHCQQCQKELTNKNKSGLCRECCYPMLEPTPEEIAEAKEAIQAEWNKRTEFMRRVHHVDPWEPPTVTNHGQQQEPSE